METLTESEYLDTSKQASKTETESEIETDLCTTSNNHPSDSSRVSGSSNGSNNDRSGDREAFQATANDATASVSLDEKMKQRRLSSFRASKPSNLIIEESSSSSSSIDTQPIQVEHFQLDIEGFGGHTVHQDNFEKIRLLGTGMYGKVFLVRTKGIEHDEGNLYAMKVLDKHEMVKHNRVRRIMTEKEILAIVNHPFIVTLYYTFQTDTQLFFVMQYCPGGEFFHLLQQQKEKRLSEKDAKFYAAEILLALEYLHLLGFIYRDLKPENIVVHESGHVMLTDFDLSYHQSYSPVKVSPSKRKSWSFQLFHPNENEPDDEPRRWWRRFHCCCCCMSSAKNYPDVDTETHLSEQERRSSFVGTHEYLAPEIFSDEGYAGSVDWWAFGILIYEMLFGNTPFKGETKMDTLEKIVNADAHVTFPKSVCISSECKSLLRSLLHKDAKKRLQNPTAIKAHPFFRDTCFALIRNQKPPIVPYITNLLDTRNFIDFDAIDAKKESTMNGAGNVAEASAIVEEKDKELFQTFNFTKPLDSPKHWKPFLIKEQSETKTL